MRIADPLQLSLREAGVEQVEPDDAALVVELLDQRRERRSISTTGSTRAAEYQTILAVRYRILDATGMELSGPAWIERQRVYRIDKANVMGSSEEQTLLERELVQDVVGQIIRAMDAVSRKRDINAVSAHAD